MGCCASKGVDSPRLTTTEHQLASQISRSNAATAAGVFRVGDALPTAPVSDPESAVFVQDTDAGFSQADIEAATSLSLETSAQARIQQDMHSDVQSENRDHSPKAAHPHATSSSSQSLAKSLFIPTLKESVILAEPGLSSLRPDTDYRPETVSITVP